jgi:hypothetical protein
LNVIRTERFRVVFLFRIRERFDSGCRRLPSTRPQFDDKGLTLAQGLCADGCKALSARRRFQLMRRSRRPPLTLSASSSVRYRLPLPGTAVCSCLAGISIARRKLKIGMPCAETEPDASPTCNGYDLDGAASRNGYSSPTQNQGASRNGYESASRNGYELIVYRDTTTPEGGVPKGVLGTPFARAVPDPTEAITEQQFEEVRSLADTFGKRPGAMVVRQTRRDEIEGDLRTTVQPVVEKHGAQIAR